MTIHKYPILLAATIACLLPETLPAAVIAAWDVDGIELDATGASGIDGHSTSSPFTFSAGTIDSNLQSAKLTLSSTVNNTTSTNQYGFKISGTDETTSLSAAITADHYLQFSLESASGFHINLESLEMNGESSGTGANNIAILSSVDGFVSTNVIASLGNFKVSLEGLIRTTVASGDPFL